MIQTASVIIRNDKGQILGVSRKNDHSDMNLPGGKMESIDKDILEALRREVKEETGLDLHDLELVFEGAYFDGFYEHTYTGTATGEISFDPIKEPHVVKWCEPEEIMDGGFGEYNEMVFSMIGIKRRRGAARKSIPPMREEESSIAKLRNKLSPMVSYFSMRKELEENKTLTIPQQIELHRLIEEQYEDIQERNMPELLALVKNDAYWL